MEPTTCNETAALATQLVDGTADGLPSDDWHKLIALAHAASHAAIARSVADAVTLLERIASAVEDSDGTAL